MSNGSVRMPESDVDAPLFPLGPKLEHPASKTIAISIASFCISFLLANNLLSIAFPYSCVMHFPAEFE